MELERLRSLIARSRWQYARTYPTAPHEYTVFEWNPKDEAEYREFARHIVRDGIIGYWYRQARPYLHLDGYKYWIMSNPQECTLINRTFDNQERIERLLKITCDSKFQYQHGMTLASIEKEMVK